MPKMAKKTRGQTYYQYLVKWKGKLVEDASWMTTAELQKFNADPETLMDKSFLPRESDAGASGFSQQCDYVFTCYGYQEVEKH